MIMSEKPTYEELEKRAAELEQQVGQYHSEELKNPPEIHSILLDAFQQIPLCKTFEEAARKIFDQCKKLTGARSGYIARLSEDGKENEVLFLDAGGIPCDVDPDLPMPIRGLREIAYKTKDVVYDNAFSESSWMKYIPQRHMRLDNVLFAPVNIENQTVGIIGIANKAGEFSKRDVHIAKIFGDLAAIALTYAHSQESLRESEERYRSLFNNINDAVYIHKILPSGEPSRFLHVNKAALKMLGYTAGELTSKSPLNLDDPDESSRYIPKVMKQLHDKGAANFEAVQIAKDGRKINVEVNAVVTDIGGEDCILSVCRDITERKQAEEALLASEKRFRGLTEMLPEAVFETNVNMDLTYANQQAFSLFGFSKEDVEKGLNSLEMLASEDRQRGVENIAKRFQGKSIGISEYLGLRKDGSTFPILLHASPIIKQGTIEGLRGIIVDISGRKQAEEERKKLHEQLQQSQKLESIGNLAGGIAHDFNNILSSIIGFTELALDDVEKGTKVEDSLQEVYVAGKRAKDLVKQILAFARQSDEQLKPLEAATITKEDLKFIRSSIPTSIEIKHNIESDSLIMGNPTQFHQVLMNLCTNAASAMEDKGGTLQIQLKDILIDCSTANTMDLEPGDYIEIKVSDTGTGISSDLCESIFEPYFTTKAPGEGTGMGLALVHGIVESYRGKITADSVLDEGTTFKIYLPITRKRNIHRPYEPGELPKGNESILFVDDEAPIAKMGSLILESLGYKVTTSTSSVEALELFRSKPNDFDLVVTDMTMPNMTGDKLAIELMKIRSNIPVILCTGYSKKISDEAATGIGIKAFAYKPIVKADLANTVRKVLDEAQQNHCE